jgi:hypothetical protein
MTETYTTMPLRISSEMLARIDAYWHDHRLMSRAAAIRVLLTWALDASRQAPRRPQADPPAAQQDVEQE